MAHLKRLTTPRSWSLPRKTLPWAVRPEPGRHPLERSLPILIILRDYLKVADTAREAQRIIAQGQVLVDGRKATSPKLAVGLMDVVSLPLTKSHYRVLPDYRGRLQLESIPESNSNWKLVRIENKTTVRGGKTQLNLHDGRNLLVAKDTYTTGDVLKLSLPEQKILDHLPLAAGNLGLVIGGRHSGEVSQVESHASHPGMNPASVTFESGLTILKEYTFIIGKDKAEIKLPEEVIA